MSTIRLIALLALFVGMTQECQAAIPHFLMMARRSGRTAGWQARFHGNGLGKPVDV